MELQFFLDPHQIWAADSPYQDYVLTDLIKNILGLRC